MCVLCVRKPYLVKFYSLFISKAVRFVFISFLVFAGSRWKEGKKEKFSMKNISFHFIYIIHLLENLFQPANKIHTLNTHRLYHCYKQ